ncbi:MAG: DUF2344 domain-containing protein [Pirellulaceae bacterium]|nr:DUF2344 domain-containing protein [Pirellulaceae bacterium]
MVRLRVRIRFTKQGDLRLIGHRDLMRCFEWVFRRAGLALSFSQGFHPKPRMTFPSALAVGIEGLNEVMEVELAKAADTEDILRRLRLHAPPGLVFLAAEALPEGSRKVRVHSVCYEASIPAPQPGLQERIDSVLSAAAWPFVRPNRSAAIDLRPPIRSLSYSDGTLAMRLDCAAVGGNAGPRDVLAVLGMEDLERRGGRLRRTDVEVCQ